MIAEIERGQMYFENEQIAAEYGAALKRQRIRRLAAMPFYKKFYIFVKAGFEHIIPEGVDHIQAILEMLQSQPGVEYISHSDRTFLIYFGSKIEIQNRAPMKTRDGQSMA